MLEFVTAQAATPFDWLTGLASNGLLGLLLAIALMALRAKDKELSEERRERLSDAKAIVEMVKAHTEAMTKWTISQDERNKSTEALTSAVQALTPRAAR